MQIRSPFAALRMSPELACEFFGAFSRFEYVLKEMGYLVANRQRRAEPDWHRFARDTERWLQVVPSSPLEEAIRYLTEHPPQVQMENGSWQPQQLHGRGPVAQAIDAARRVRNNLFHGGKHTAHSEGDRDERLVRSALTLLMTCLEQSDALRATFEQTEF